MSEPSGEHGPIWSREESDKLREQLRAQGVEIPEPQSRPKGETVVPEQAPESPLAENPTEFREPSPGDAPIFMSQEELARGLEEERKKAQQERLANLSRAISDLMDEAERERNKESPGP